MDETGSWQSKMMLACRLVILVSALLATLCLHLHMLDYYSMVGMWYTPQILRRITVFAAVILVAALGLMAWYISQVITKHQGATSCSSFNG